MEEHTYIHCPACGGDMEVGFNIDGPDPSVGIRGSAITDAWVTHADCECPRPTEQELLDTLEEADEPYASYASARDAWADRHT